MTKPRGLGGYRLGAGRKPGGRNKIQKETFAKAEAGGVMPLDLLLEQMREFHTQYKALGRKKNADLEELKALKELAATRAKDAAPYLHPRLQSIAHREEPPDLSKLTEEQLEQLRAIKQLTENDKPRVH